MPALQHALQLGSPDLCSSDTSLQAVRWVPANRVLFPVKDGAHGIAEHSNRELHWPRTRGSPLPLTALQSLQRTQLPLLSDTATSTQPVTRSSCSPPSSVPSALSQRCWRRPANAEVPTASQAAARHSSHSSHCAGVCISEHVSGPGRQWPELCSQGIAEVEGGGQMPCFLGIS